MPARVESAAASRAANRGRLAAQRTAARIARRNHIVAEEAPPGTPNPAHGRGNIIKGIPTGVFGPAPSHLAVAENTDRTIARERRARGVRAAERVANRLWPAFAKDTGTPGPRPRNRYLSVKDPWLQEHPSTLAYVHTGKDRRVVNVAPMMMGMLNLRDDSTAAGRNAARRIRRNAADIFYHEWAHTRQSKPTLRGEKWEVEGGAEAYNQNLGHKVHPNYSTAGLVSDEYRGFVGRVRGTKGNPWIDRGQFLGRETPYPGPDEWNSW